MPDDNVIRSSTQVDTSGLREGLAQSQDVVERGLASIKAQYKTATDSVRESTKNLADAQVQLGKLAAQGSKEAQAALTQYETELVQASAKQLQLSAAIAETNSQLNPGPTLDAAAALRQLQLIEVLAAESALEEAAAVRTMGEAHTAAVSQIQATSGALRVLEGTGGIRAAERLLVMLPGLGNAFQLAFPVVGALALGEAIYKIWERTDPLIEAQKNLAQVTQETDRQFEQLATTFEHLKVEQITAELGKAAGMKLAAFYSDTSADQDKARIAYLADLVERTKARIASESQITPSNPFRSMVEAFNPFITGEKFAGLRDASAQVENVKAYQAEIDGLNEKQKVDQARRDTDAAKAKKDEIEEQKKAQREAIEAARKATADLAKADNDRLAELKANHEATIPEEIQFWELLSRIESDNTERVHDITVKLGTLYQERDKKLDETLKHGQEIEKKNAEEQTRFAEREQRTIDELDRMRDEQIAKEQAQQFRLAEIRSRASAQVADITVKGAGQSEDLAIEQRKLEVERAYGLELSHTASQQVAYDRQIAALDAESRAAKVAAVEAELKIAQATLITAQAKLVEAKTDQESAKAAEDEARAQVKIVELQRQINQLKGQGANADYKAETKALNDQEAQYRQFFNQLNQGFTRAFDAMITGQKNWQQQFQNIWKQTVIDFENKLIEMGLKWVEQELLMTLAHAAGTQTRVAISAAGAAQTQAISASTTLKEITHDAVKAASGAYAAVAGIPIIGPILAPIAAAGAFVGVEALGALASLDVGTNYVPKQGLYELHEGESVTPKQYNPAAGGSAPGGHSFHYHAAPGASSSDRQSDINAGFSHFKRMARKFNS